jgi:hypothetical protein
MRTLKFLDHSNHVDVDLQPDLRTLQKVAASTLYWAELDLIPARKVRAVCPFAPITIQYVSDSFYVELELAMQLLYVIMGNSNFDIQVSRAGKRTELLPAGVDGTIAVYVDDRILYSSCFFSNLRCDLRLYDPPVGNGWKGDLAWHSQRGDAGIQTIL